MTIWKKLPGSPADAGRARRARSGVPAAALKSDAETTDPFCMGRDETSVIDVQPTVGSEQQTPAAGTTPPAPAARPRRRRILVGATAVAAVAAAAVVWSTVGGDTAAADRGDTGTTRAEESAAAPSEATASESAAAVETAAPQAATGAGAAPSAAASPSAPKAEAPPAGWETRSFQGVSFSVPPGAQSPDVTDPGNADAPALFMWNGPSLGGDVSSQIAVWIHPAGDAPTLGTDYQVITVPGADQAHMFTGPIGSEPPSVGVDMHIIAGDRFINIVGQFAVGSAGEQMVRDLIASVSVG
jgi:hypothetical protein